MKLSHRAFPHPVVGNANDVVDTAFQAPIEVHNDVANFYLKAQVQCSSRTVRKLVDRGDAVYVMHVECGNTFYRQAFEFSKPEEEVMIPGEFLNSTVEVNVVARAKRDIKRYQVENSHPDYGDATFAIRAGDILAVSEGYSFDADITFDNLKKIGSIMQVVELDEPGDAPMAVDLTAEKITICLCKGDFENYKLIRQNKLLSASLIATLVLPALVEALTHLKGDHSDVEGTRWCRSLKRRVETLGLSTEAEALENAQRILELPLRRAFMSARTMIEQPGE
ncbi:MAG: hypothetical protein J0M17_08265 [Planctomycetes bacterium]|nr:hypothetical protein [Planctomycetota bacterium]